METTELTYHGRTLTQEPANLTWNDLVYVLSEHRVVEVVLEPGDATRYDLTVSVASSGDRMLVVRTRGNGGEMRAAAFVYPDMESMESREAIATLADGNDWTGELLAWWIGKLWAALNAGH